MQQPLLNRAIVGFLNDGSGQLCLAIDGEVVCRMSPEVFFATTGEKAVKGSIVTKLVRDSPRK